MTAGRVVVVGGGVIGLACALRLAWRGVRVTIVDPRPGRGTSWVAGGMLAPVAEAQRGEEALRDLALASAERWPGFAATVGGTAGCETGYTRNGTLVVARDGDDLGELNDLGALQAEAGLRSERVTSRQARRLEPALAPSVRGALWLADDHQVDNRQLLRSLERAVLAVGAEICREPATVVRGRSVVTASGSVLDADAVVVATGAQPPPIEVGGEPIAVPVRPVKGQIVRVRATTGAVFPTRTVRGLDVYVIPRATGEIAIGATSEEKGYDTTVTAGAVHTLLRDAWELLPGLAEAEFVEAVAGLRPGTPDNAPLLGWLGGDGPLVALGHYRHGVLLAPITADAVAAALLGDTDTELARLVAPFTPSRFGPPRPDGVATDRLSPAPTVEARP